MMGLMSIWFLQDLTQVFGVGLFPVPDLILFLLLYRLTAKEPELIGIIWCAFLTGLVWDLRWASFAGLSSLFYVIAVVVFFVAWTNVPSSARTSFLSLVLLVIAQSIVSVGRVLFTLAQEGTVIQFCLIQQVLALPVAVVVAWLVGKRIEDHE